MKLNRNSFTRYRKISFPVAIFSLLSVVLFSSSCRKDKGTNSDCAPCKCQPTPPSPSDQGYNFLSGNFSIQCASFNPNRDNELAYSVINYSNGDRGIYKYNLDTEESVELYDGQVKFNIEWGVNDWIIFNSLGGDIWKVKSSGDSLTLLTEDAGASSPSWNFTSDSIVFRKGEDETSILIDQNGTILDTLSSSFSSSIQAWNHPKYIVSTALGKLVLKSIQDSTINNIHILEDDLSVYSGCDDEIGLPGGSVWVNDDIYYTHSLGLFKADISGGNSSLIKESCTSRSYKFPSVNSSKDKLLFVRWDQKVVGHDENSVLTTQTLVTMNLDGSNEVELEVN